MWCARKYRWWILSALLVLGGLIPALTGGGVHAAPPQSYPALSVIISEVAWGGTAASQADEWIELYNPGNQPINLSDWALSADDGDPDISLAGTIGAGGFFLLERTDDSTISDITANQIFYSPSGLSNNGEILRLYAPDSSVIDTANQDGGGWPAGSSAPGYYSMERVGPVPDGPGAWASNNGIVRNGLDANGNPINGTPGHLYALWPAENTPTGTNTPTATATPTLTGTATSTTTNTGSPTTTGTPTNTPTPTITGSLTDTNTPTNTGTPTNTPTPTITGSLANTGTPTNTPTPTITGSLANTSTPTNTPTPTGSTTVTLTATSNGLYTTTPTAPAHLVISEFRTRGPNGADDEFVELYNPTGAAVNIGYWMIRRSSSCGTSITNLVIIPLNTILLAGQHYLAASTSSSVNGADQFFSAGMADDGGVALADSFGTTVDQAGMCTTTQYQEGTVLAPLVGNANQSYERKPGGATSCYDTNNNARDFALISPSNPQNRASQIVMCAGVFISTSTSTPTITPTRTPTRAPTALPGIVVINEFLPHPHSDWNGDGTVNTGDEYIELMNMGTDPISLNFWKLDNGVGGHSTPYALPNMTLLPHQIVVFYHSETGISLSDGGDTVRLLKPDGRTSDIITYPVVTAADETWCRLPDGRGVWAFACSPTPGMLNIPIESITPTPTATPGPGGEENAGPNCLADPAPQPIQSAECNSPGAKVWGMWGSGEIWLQSRWKWDVFVR